ncbi:MAG: selenocysteine-specific translation elongation factor, partial [Deltaproteobacteria bacterium]|nr:selenocysteine-specific translation elongation factor [Deltaproteobacteria bacterium]
MALPPIGNNTQKGNFSITEHRSKLRHFVVGTGGHIDHGKSTLVKALTLTDPDRFIEEKKRGITIDLGFASYKADEDLEISFIDVPGHEKFVHNMLAGIGGVEMFLLVVAADGGVMPQTREHLAIADLLKIQKGLVVLSRLDLADEEMTDLVFEEVKELTKGSFLEDKPIVKVSAQTGLGLDELKKQLALTANSPVAPRKEQPFRMPIDRSFSIKGFGTVITGTVLSGSASLRDPLWLYPQKIPLKPRSFENHKNKVEEVHSGQRLAVNLGGIHKDQIERGNQIAKPNSVYNTRRVDVELSLVPGIKAIKNKSLIRFYSNAQEVTGNITFVDKTFSPDQKVHFAQIRLIDEVCLRYGDRFILRNLSPSETIAGGKILAPLGNRYRR